MNKLFLFDFDGTLFDSMWVWAHIATDYLRAKGISAPADLEEQVASMSLLQAGAYLHTRFGLAETAEEIMDQILSAVAHRYQHEILPKPGAEDFLKACARQKIPCYILTASDSAQVAAALKRCGLCDFLRGIFTCTQLELSKDSPAIFEKTAELLKVFPAQITVFEDAPHAAYSAQSAGCTVYGLYEPFFEKQWPALEACCAACFHDLTEMRSIL